MFKLISKGDTELSRNSIIPLDVNLGLLNLHARFIIS
jgi:hypothetical protein